MKKILVCLLMVILVLSFASCGVKDKVEEKAGEALAEKIMEDAGVDADIDGDKVVLKGEDGEEFVFGDTDWPSSELAKSIPELKSGKVVTVMEANDSALIGLEEVSKEDAKDYFDEIKGSFTEESYSMESDGSVTYGGKNAEGTAIIIVYMPDETFSITVMKAEEEISEE